MESQRHEEAAMHAHQLATIIGSSATAVVIAVLAGVPFVRMLPLLLILGVPLAALLALRAADALDAPADSDDGAATAVPRRSQLQHH